MNLKRTFGAILTVLGIIGLVYTGVLVVQSNGQSVTVIVVVGLISLLFFFSGVSLVKTTTDHA